MATARSNRLLGCSLKNEKELKNKGRGSYEEKEAFIDGVNVWVVRWFDNRAVTFASTCSSIQPLLHVQRFDKKQKQSIAIPCPSIVCQYNQNMGGGDALDALVSYYQIKLKSKKYYLRFFFHFVDVAIVNGRLLCRRACDFYGITYSKQNDLLVFKSRLAKSLCKVGKDMQPANKRGRPSLELLQPCASRACA